MTAELRFVSLASPERPSRGRGGHDGKPARLMLGAGTTDRLREAPLTREQLLTLAEKAIHIVLVMDREASQ